LHNVQKEGIPGAFSLFPLKLNVFDNYSTRDLRLPGFGEALKKVQVGIAVPYELKGIRMIDSTPCQRCETPERLKGKWDFVLTKAILVNYTTIIRNHSIPWI
jgi:hypothetical protein